MNNLIEWFTKKNVLLISTISSLFFIILVQKRILFFLCDPHISSCVNFVNYLVLITMIGATIFIPSLVLQFLDQEIFNSWIKLTLKYIIFYLFVMLVVPWYAGDGFMHIQK